MAPAAEGAAGRGILGMVEGCGRIEPRAISQNEREGSEAAYVQGQNIGRI